MHAAELRAGQIKGTNVSKYELKFPDEYDDYAWEYKAKGWIAGVVLSYEGAEYHLNIYTPERLFQDLEDGLQGSLFFFEPNLLIVPVIERPKIEAAIARLISRGDVSANMCPSKPKAGSLPD
jgi:hypothetical protein